ncbi:MAG: DUF6416 domain-containing protein [Microthrixaceae bacterium]
MPISLVLSETVTITVDQTTATSLASQLASAGYAPQSPPPTAAAFVLTEDDPRWSNHSGGAAHEVQDWSDGDLDAAVAFYRALPTKARVFVDLLIDHPGEQLTSKQMCALSNGVFDNDHQLAGSIKGLWKPAEAAQRRYPFTWWQDRPTRYAMRPSVAALFAEARARSAR